VIAAVALGQLSSCDGALALRVFAQSVRRIPSDEIAELAAAVRAAGHPIPPSAPLLTRLAETRGYAQLDLADALLEPHRTSAQHDPNVSVPLPTGRLDDAVDSVAENERTRLASAFLSHAGASEPAVRASCAVFAAHLDPSLGTAIVLQRLADADEHGEVRTVARALMDRVIDARRE
jgi:hypothetical protein